MVPLSETICLNHIARISSCRWSRDEHESYFIQKMFNNQVKYTATRIEKGNAYITQPRLPLRPYARVRLTIRCYCSVQRPTQTSGDQTV